MALSGTRPNIRLACATILAGLLAATAGAWLAVSTAAAATHLGVSVSAGTTSVSLSTPLPAPLAAVHPESVTVKTPTVTAPTVAVEVPVVTVKTPAAPVKPPTVSVKTPSVSVKAPTGPARAPSLPAKAPTMPVKTPTLPTATSPTSSVRVPGTAKSVAGAASSALSGSGSAAGGSAATSGANSGDGSPGDQLSPYYRAPDTGLPRITGASEAGGRIDRSEPARIARERFLRETVKRLEGCLGDLPQRSRLALELRTGLGRSRPLGPRAVAERLHLGIDRFSRLEQKAVVELRAMARMHGCARVTQTVVGALAFVDAGFAGGKGGAASGVEAVRYTSNPSRSSAAKRSGSPSRGWLFGTGIPPTASDAILVLLLLLAGGIALAALAADSAGQGPRHWQWRRRIINRLPWLR